MTRPPAILLANHHTASLPDVGAALAAAGASVRTSQNIVSTAAALDEQHPDVVVFQPLTANLAGFEVRHVLEKAHRDGTAASVVLILEDADALSHFEDRTSCGVDDFLFRPTSESELVLRIEFALSRSQRWRSLQKKNKSLQRECITDFKTGLHNDRFFYQRLQQEVSRSRRHGLPLSLVMFDFDDFKRINDDFDHTFGDFVLLSFAKKLCTVVRQIDIPARLGGDEFALLLPNTDLEEAAQLATRLRLLMSDATFEKDGHSTGLALSMGIDSLQGEQSDPEEFLRRADLALIEAKKRGKNRICLYPEIAGTQAAAASGARPRSLGNPKTPER